MSNTCETEIIEYDDHGVLCKYNQEIEGWEPIEDFCNDCGYKPEDCECMICKGCNSICRNSKSDFCSHGVCDGICCECKECRKEMGLCCICDEDEATEFHRGDGYCESCAVDNWKLIMQDMADEEDRINAEDEDEDELRGCDCCGESEKNGKKFTYDNLVEQEDGNSWWCNECVEK
jgi:hypothetical protein